MLVTTEIYDMKEFNKEKEQLLLELNKEIKIYSNCVSLKSLKNILDEYKCVQDIHGGLSYIIRDSLELDLKISEKLIDFENYFSDYSNSIKSDELRKIAKYLIKTNKKITFYGKSWENCKADWLYFDTIFDIEKIKKKLFISENIIVHENLDIRSGLERGFLDERTGEGIMGKVK